MEQDFSVEAFKLLTSLPRYVASPLCVLNSKIVPVFEAL